MLLNDSHEAETQITNAMLVRGQSTTVWVSDVKNQEPADLAGESKNCV